jgi:hypothetical protein
MAARSGPRAERPPSCPPLNKLQLGASRKGDWVYTVLEAGKLGFMNVRWRLAPP